MASSDRQRNLDEVTLPNPFAYSRFVEPATGGDSSARGPAPRRGRCRLPGFAQDYGNPILTRHVRESCSDSQHASQIDLGLLHVHVSTCMTCSSTGTYMRVSVRSTTPTRDQSIPSDYIKQADKTRSTPFQQSSELLSESSKPYPSTLTSPHTNYSTRSSIKLSHALIFS